VDASSKQIVCVYVADGSVHDFKMLKKSKIRIRETTTVLADSGFQGIHKLHLNAEIPQKKTKNHPLTKAQKRENKQLAHKRILVEHVNRMMKIFLILKYPYRNKQKRFRLRVHLLAGIYNQNLRQKLNS
jgi:IS5 family transposase